MKNSRSFTSLLIIGATVLHLILTPVLFSGILLYLKNTYTEQFIDNTRSSTSLIISQLSQYNFNKESKEVRMFLDEILLGGQITFAELHLDNNKKLKPLELNEYNQNFKEDFYFGEHDDNTYFIMSQVSDQYTGS
ncbi:MAG: hypothetical protein R3240_04625 [Gammaproteobacteria bacterium]|nr:hypothetical protein [Gammaproteobacteria bacterium]